MKASRDDSGRDQGRTVLQLVCRHGRANWSDAGRRRARAVQSLLSARLRHRDPDRRPLAHAEPARRDSAAAAVDRAAVRSRDGRRSRRRPACTARRGHQIPDGRRRRRDEHVGACCSRARRFSRASPRRDDGVDGEEGLQLGRSDARIDEPAVGQGLDARSCAATTSRSSRAIPTPATERR